MNTDKKEHSQELQTQTPEVERERKKSPEEKHLWRENAGEREALEESLSALAVEEAHILSAMAYLLPPNGASFVLCAVPKFQIKRWPYIRCVSFYLGWMVGMECLILRPLNTRWYVSALVLFYLDKYNGFPFLISWFMLFPHHLFYPVHPLCHHLCCLWSHHILIKVIQLLLFSNIRHLNPNLNLWSSP